MIDDNFDMPEFKEDGVVYVWDPTSHSYVPKDGGYLGADHDSDIGHAHGGDSNLFDTDDTLDGNYEKTENPLMEGWVAHLASDWEDGEGESVCDWCGAPAPTLTNIPDHRLEGGAWVCPACHRAYLQDQGVELSDSVPGDMTFPEEWQKEGGLSWENYPITLQQLNGWIKTLWIESDHYHPSDNGAPTYYARDEEGHRYAIGPDGKAEVYGLMKPDDWTHVGFVSDLPHYHEQMWGDVASDLKAPDDGLRDDEPGDLTFPEGWDRLGNWTEDHPETTSNSPEPSGNVVSHAREAAGLDPEQIARKALTIYQEIRFEYRNGSDALADAVDEAIQLAEGSLGLGEDQYWRINDLVHAEIDRIAPNLLDDAPEGGLIEEPEEDDPRRESHVKTASEDFLPSRQDITKQQVMHAMSELNLTLYEDPKQTPEIKQEDADSFAITDGSVYIWAYFGNDILVGLESFGQNVGRTQSILEALSLTLDTDFLSEHSEEYWELDRQLNPEFYDEIAQEEEHEVDEPIDPDIPDAPPEDWKTSASSSDDYQAGKDHALKMFQQRDLSPNIGESWDDVVKELGPTVVENWIGDEIEAAEGLIEEGQWGENEEWTQGYLDQLHELAQLWANYSEQWRKQGATEEYPADEWLYNVGTLAGQLYLWVMSVGENVQEASPEDARWAAQLNDWWSGIGASLHDRLQPEDWQILLDAFVEQQTAPDKDQIYNVVDQLELLISQFDKLPFNLQNPSYDIGGLNIRVLDEEMNDNQPGDTTFPADWKTGKLARNGEAFQDDEGNWYQPFQYPDVDWYGKPLHGKDEEGRSWQSEGASLGHFAGSPHWANWPPPGYWKPGKYDDWRCPNCDTPVELEPTEAAPWNKDIHAGVGHFEWHCPNGECNPHVMPKWWHHTISPRNPDPRNNPIPYGTPIPQGTQGFYYPDERLIPGEPKINYKIDPETGQRRAESVDCVCRTNVPIWNYWTNQCPTCGRDYDSNGNLLAPRSQWGSETGEGYTDEYGDFHSDFDGPEGEDLNRQMMWDNLKKLDIDPDDPSDRLASVPNQDGSLGFTMVSDEGNYVNFTILMPANSDISQYHGRPYNDTVQIAQDNNGENVSLSDLHSLLAAGGGELQSWSYSEPINVEMVGQGKVRLTMGERSHHYDYNQPPVVEQGWQATLDVIELSQSISDLTRERDEYVQRANEQRRQIQDLYGIDEHTAEEGWEDDEEGDDFKWSARREGFLAPEGPRPEPHQVLARTQPEPEDSVSLAMQDEVQVARVVSAVTPQDLRPEDFEIGLVDAVTEADLRSQVTRLAAEGIAARELNVHNERVAVETLTPIEQMPDINNVLDYNPEDIVEAPWRGHFHTGYMETWHECKECTLVGSWREAHEFLLNEARDFHASWGASGSAGDRRVADRYGMLVAALENAVPNEPFKYHFEDPGVQWQEWTIEQMPKTGKLAMPYHVSPRENRDAIEQHGLRTQDINHAGSPQEPDGIYYWDTEDQARHFMNNDLKQSEGADIWRFDLEPEEQDRVRDDPFFDEGNWFMEDAPEELIDPYYNEDDSVGGHFLEDVHHIPPERLKRITSVNFDDAC